MSAKARATIKSILAAIALIVMAWAATRLAVSPSSEASVADAVHEGRLVIYSATDKARFSPLLAAFQSEYPLIEVEYESLAARDVYQRTRSELDRGMPRADLVISSAMDLQIRLVNDRYAQPYASPHRAHLPDWAVWKDQAFAVSSEPIVIGYNKRMLDPSEVPVGHDELAALLNAQRERFSGRIGTYDPENSPTGYQNFSADLRVDQDNWDLISAIGRSRPRLFTSTSDAIDRVQSGSLLIAYNLIGSYAMQRAETQPDFGIVVPRDYVLLESRVALIPRSAPHGAAARLFLDFMLSRRGQTLMKSMHMMPVRDDVPDGNILAGSNIRAIRVGPALMADLDESNRTRFFIKWRSSVERHTNFRSN